MSELFNRRILLNKLGVKSTLGSFIVSSEISIHLLYDAIALSNKLVVNIMGV